VTEQGQPIPHQHYVAELSDLAIGVLDGRERAAVLDHVADCASCTAELEQLTAVVDSLVHVAPEVEPPIGFETRVLNRLQVPSSIPTIHRGWRRSLLASAAAAVVALAFGIGWVVHSATGSRVVNAIGSPKGYVAEATLVTPGGQSTGSVSVYPGYAGSPSWLFMTVSTPSWTGSARCAITSTDGTTHIIGAFSIVAGHQASWGAPLPVAAKSVQKAELIAPDGHILASANLS
jgi:anti-sigma factor RsiW